MKSLLFIILLSCQALSAKTGLMFAHPKELGDLVRKMEGPVEVVEAGRRIYHSGKLFGEEVVIVNCRVGKVAAAACATDLIARSKVDRILLIGLAAAADPCLNIGDVVLGNAFIQHDLDSRPFIPRYNIPFLGVREILVDEEALSQVKIASETFLQKKAKVQTGLIASGDQFIHDNEILLQLKKDLPDLLSIDMESAAVAQVCYEYDLPFVCIRVISDTGDKEAHINVAEFLENTMSEYRTEILRLFLSIPKS